MFELIRYDTANVIDDYASQEEALEVVRAIVHRSGEGAVTTLTLAAIDDAGELHEIATGPDLVALARVGVAA